MSNIRQNFKYPVIDHKTRVFGEALASVEINPSGDWRNVQPQAEPQSKGLIEASDCFIEGQQHAIASAMKFLYAINPDFSGRFNALLAGGTESGGDPVAGAESIRKDGLIPDSMMPFSDDIESWDDFHSWLGADEMACKDEGKAFLSKWKLNYRIIIEKEMPLEEKYSRLRQALKSSPVAISVYGQVDAEGNYVPKQPWMSDTHMVECTYIDSDDRIHIRDTYAPFDKILPADYNPDFGIGWSVNAIPPSKSLWQRFKEWFLKNKLIYREFKIFNINRNK